VAANVASVGESFFYGRALGLTSALMLVVFASCVAVRMRQLRGPDTLWSPLALGGGLVAATLQINAAVAQLSMARNEGAGTDPELLVALLDLGFGFVLAMLPLSLLVAAVGLGGVGGRGGLVGRASAGREWCCRWRWWWGSSSSPVAWT
jgi:hypothetical protein